MKTLIHALPKVELHLHIEGTLEPELMFRLAQKNHIEIPYRTIEEIKDAYQFSSLQSFLDLYYGGTHVLINEEDFFQLTWEYLQKCKQQNIVHTEVMFDPQAHTSRGVPLQYVIHGISRALTYGKKELGISSCLILNFLRHLSQEEAYATLKEALPFQEHFIAVGLDSGELGNPPSKFREVFEKARSHGLMLVAHAGEEADSSYIWGALKDLQVQRIDHGIRCEEDESLVAHLAQSHIPLTVCPLSNTALHAIEKMQEHNILRLLQKGLLVTVNSDDPAYFGGYLNENFEALYRDLGMTKEQLIQLVKNGVTASFLEEEEKKEIHAEIVRIAKILDDKPKGLSKRVT